jgi:putative transcriptional regulator
MCGSPHLYGGFFHGQKRNPQQHVELFVEVIFMAIRNNLKDIRYDNRMDQKQFSSYLGVNQSLYNRWERQNTQPSVEWLLKISKRINKPIEDIVYLEESE